MLKSLVVAIGFLTRIPVPTGQVDGPALGRAVTWFPAVGALLGAIVLGVYHLLAGRIAPALAAVALITALAGITGGLHLDGAADVFDALGGGRGNRERMLAIMRDSRIGAHGAAALVLLLAAKLVAVAELITRPSAPTWALFGFPIAARWAVVPLVVVFPYARPDGLGKPFHGHAGVAQLAGASALSILAVGWIGPPVVAPTLAAIAIAFAFAFALSRRLGGITGDVCGAAIELAELAFLVVAGLP